MRRTAPRSGSPLAPRDQPQVRATGLHTPLPTGVEDVVEAQRRRTQVVRLVATVVPLEPHARSIECLPQPIPLGHWDDDLMGERSSLGPT